MFRKLTRAQLVFDLTAPGVLFLLVASVYLLRTGFGYIFVLLGMCAALALWRLSPLLSLAVAWLTAILQMVAGLDSDPSNLAVFVVLYSTAAYGDRPTRWLGFASTFVAAGAIGLYLVVVPWLLAPASPVQDVVQGTLAMSLGVLALFLLVWTLGLLTKTYRTARESRRAQTAAEAEQARARLDVSVEQERTRIARDMHDVVAHSLAVVIAQADGARYARATDPQAVDDALTTISSTARDALADVRVLLAQLRHNQVSGPQPTIADLNRLIDQVRAAGLDIRYSVSGESGPLGTNQQLSLYRVVQEALTNALRHGDRRQPVDVAVHWSDVTVDASVTNATAFRDGFVPGHGLAGMRERALIVGGTLTVRSDADLFSVSISVPRVGGHTGQHLPVTARSA